MGLLSTKQKNALVTRRHGWHDAYVTAYEFDRTKYSSDAYNRASVVSTGATVLTGSVAWGRTVQRDELYGGSRIIGDCAIVFPLHSRTVLEKEKTYLVVDEIRVEVRRTVICDSTSEIVVYCDRL